MKLCLKILAIAIITVSTYPLISCAGPASYSYHNISIELTLAECNSCINNGTPPQFNPSYPQGVQEPGTVLWIVAPNNGTTPGSVLYAPQGGGSQGYCFPVTAEVANAAPNLTWTIYPTPTSTEPSSLPSGTGYPPGENGNGSSLGTVNLANGITNYWCIPGSPPIYTGSQLVQANSMAQNFGLPNIPQGDVELVVSVPSDPSNPSATFSTSILMQVFAPVGSSPRVFLDPVTPTGDMDSVLTISHLAPNNTYQFNGFAVGGIPCQGTGAAPNGCTQANGTVVPQLTADNSVVWEVGTATGGLASGVVGGSTAEGTITQTGLYTAPASVPAVQPLIILLDHQNTTVDALAYITIN